MDMNKERLISKIMEKPELREIPVEDVEMAISLCAKKNDSEEEIILKTRKLLHETYGAFGSRKLLVQGKYKEKEPEWILRKHLSTRERLPYYNEIYSKVLGNFKGTIFDLGAGVNGFSLGFIPKAKYIGVEGIGQLVSLMNHYFKKQRLNANAVHLSLFQLGKLKALIKKEKGKKIVFLFKVLDSLEALKKNYSKTLISEIIPLVDKIVVSFATRSMIKKKRFNVKRSWIIDFIQQRFKIIDDFELGGERYIVFGNKK